MPIFRLGPRPVFPPAELADDGLLAVGGDLEPERLIRAYSEGIFPWYSEGEPILWHSPDPRFVLTTSAFRTPTRLRRRVRARPYRLVLDRAFDEVVEACASARRPGQPGTWITRELREAYARLHRMGVAHSAEAWLGETLVGGLYGVSLGAAFFGESMFARAPDASKLALVALVAQLERWGIDLIDCQVPTEHLARFGAREWPRDRYLAALRRALERPTRCGAWAFDDAE